MDAEVLRIFDHNANLKEVAWQEYMLAESEVTTMLLNGYHRRTGQQERFKAAAERRAEARDRWIRALGA